MIEIKVGEEIPVAGALVGSDGKYWKVNVNAQRGYDKIQVWAVNPKQAKDITGMAKVESITSVKLTAHQYQGKWYPDYVINARLVQGNTEPPADFMEAGTVVDDELPFA